MTEFKLPELGENIEEAEVIRILVSEGDEIQADQNVLEVESEKASTPLPCPHAGKVAKIHVNEGDTIHVGQTLLSIEETEAKKESPSEEKSPGDEEAPEEAEEGKKPDVEEKEAVEEEKPHHKEAARREKESEEGGDGRKKDRPVTAGPGTRRVAREMGVQLEELEGTGPEGRITREDVKQAAQKGKSLRKVDVPPLPDFEKWGSVRRERMSRLARTAAERLSLSWQMVPHVTQNASVDVTALEKGRKRFNRKKDRPKLTMTTLVVKAALIA